MGSHREDRRINQLQQFREFIRSWEDPAHPQNQTPVDLHRTRYGNINSTGELGDYRGYALSRWHPQFIDSLEVGIRQLVELLTLRFGWLTYSSCQGHSYRGQGLPSVERHVGILPRSAAEKDAIRFVLATSAARVNPPHGRSAVYLEVRNEALATDHGSQEVIDVFFRRHKRQTWKRYFSELDDFYNKVLSTLSSLHDNPPPETP
jgi:uncharacterized protein